MQQLVDNTSVKNQINNLIIQTSEKLTASVERLENALQKYCNRRDQIKEDLVQELDEYISQVKSLIEVKQVENADS